MRVKLLFLFIVSLVLGCGPGGFDFSEKIGSTGLEYVDANSLSMYIDAIEADGQQKALIESSVLSYRFEANYVFGIRQVVNHYICELPDIDSFFGGVEVTSRLEFFAIKVSDNKPRYNIKVFNDFITFKDYLEVNNVNERDVSSLNPELFKDKLLHVRPLGECINPKTPFNK